jgi:hypothetical protein
MVKHLLESLDIEIDMGNTSHITEVSSLDKFPFAGEPTEILKGLLYSGFENDTGYYTYVCLPPKNSLLALGNDLLPAEESFIEGYLLAVFNQSGSLEAKLSEFHGQKIDLSGFSDQDIGLIAWSYTTLRDNKSDENAVRIMDAMFSLMGDNRTRVVTYNIGTYLKMRDTWDHFTFIEDEPTASSVFCGKKGMDSLPGVTQIKINYDPKKYIPNQKVELPRGLLVWANGSYAVVREPITGVIEPGHYGAAQITLDPHLVISVNIRSQ